MARITPVCRIGHHDIGVLYKDDIPIGGILMCITDRVNTVNVAVNIQDFKNARLIGINWVVFKIIHMNWVKINPMKTAILHMEQAPQQEGKPYKLLSKFTIEGHMEIPDDF
jgi:hypothetical protein